MYATSEPSIILLTRLTPPQSSQQWLGIDACRPSSEEDTQLWHGRAPGHCESGEVDGADWGDGKVLLHIPCNHRQPTSTHSSQWALPAWWDSYRIQFWNFKQRLLSVVVGVTQIVTPEVLRNLASLPRLLLLPIRKLAGPLKGLAGSLKSTVASLETTWEDAAYGAPAYGAPEPSYGAPAPSYGASGYARSVRKETFDHQYHMALSYSVPVPRGRRAPVKNGVKQVRIRSRISSSASNQPRHLGRPHRTKTAPIGFVKCAISMGTVKCHIHFVPQILFIWYEYWENDSFLLSKTHNITTLQSHYMVKWRNRPKTYNGFIQNTIT